MVGRIPRSTPSPAQSRRRAQRRIAKELREGTFKPSSVGKQAREAPALRKDVVNRIQAIKARMFGDRPKYSEKGSRRAIERDKNGKLRSLKDLKRILEVLEEQESEEYQENYDDLESYGLGDALYYH